MGERRGPRTDEGRGLGYWAGFAGDEFVGWWSASSFADDSTMSGVGYRLRREAWGRGLATEGGRLMVEQAFAAPYVEKVVASTMAVNAASRAVLAKARHDPRRHLRRGLGRPDPRLGAGRGGLQAHSAAGSDPGRGHHMGWRSSSIAGEAYFGW